VIGRCSSKPWYWSPSVASADNPLEREFGH
jgi:hypothetical protein